MSGCIWDFVLNVGKNGEKADWNDHFFFDSLFGDTHNMNM